MATHRQLPPNTDIAPAQEKGRWYRAFLEKDENGTAKVTYKDSGLPDITPAGYGFTMAGQKDGKTFHLVSTTAKANIGSGTAGNPAFFYPTVGQEYTADGSNYIVDFNKPETNVSLKINDTAATVKQTLNGLNQKNIDLEASVESAKPFVVTGKSLWETLNTYFDTKESLCEIVDFSDPERLYTFKNVIIDAASSTNKRTYWYTTDVLLFDTQQVDQLNSYYKGCLTLCVAKEGVLLISQSVTYTRDSSTNTWTGSSPTISYESYLSRSFILSPVSASTSNE